MFALANMMHFLANEFTRLRAWCFSFTFVPPGSFQSFLFWHTSP